MPADCGTAVMLNSPAEHSAELGRVLVARLLGVDAAGGGAAGSTGGAGAGGAGIGALVLGPAAAASLVGGGELSAAAEVAVVGVAGAACFDVLQPAMTTVAAHNARSRRYLLV